MEIKSCVTFSIIRYTTHTVSYNTNSYRSHGIKYSL